MFENHTTTDAEGEKLHRFAIRKRDPSQIEADPPTGLQRFIEQPLEHHDVLLGDLPREAKNYIGGSFEGGFDSQHTPKELNNRASKFRCVSGPSEAVNPDKP